MKKIYEGWVYVGHDSDISIYDNPERKGQNIDIGTEIEQYFEKNQTATKHIKIIIEEIDLT